MTAELVNTALVADLARLLCDREGRLRDLIRAGRIREVQRGRVALAEAVPTYFDDLRAALHAGSASASAERAREARADAAALNLAMRRRELIHREELDACLEYLCGTINAALTSLPPRVTRDVFMRRRVDELVRRTREALGRAITAVAAGIADE
ncbi:hypothetical protein G5B31_20655 [Rhodobacter sp. SGA-6-6]|uniref:hypothetical protein n=1 Tax=Rhodobacter sp. SGA-6-6 TaxID=2710882 RepID=UPI0013EDF2C9|nr:hypothetical protein [Rhodobacter sp. SGA-6-6]NGM47932.1 hypothetical protein [Rhodobacter sp. SGA-6-6]